MFSHDKRGTCQNVDPQKNARKIPDFSMKQAFTLTDLNPQEPPDLDASPICAYADQNSLLKPLLVTQFSWRIV